jgi:YD repeat-containing protein
MRYKYIKLFLLANMPWLCFAQYQKNLPEAKPIPPNAAALFKTLERPVGTYTGTIPVNFPLCSVGSGSITASLSLDYNSTGGIKVEELGGPVGLGFNLNDGGGRITQIVRGKRPDDRGGILNGTSSIRPSAFPCSMNNAEELDLSNVDLEYDVFMYSFNGHSGKFYIKENGQIILTTNDPIKIDYGSIPSWQTGFTCWTITDENGVKYFFGSRIINHSSYSGINGAGGTDVISSISYFLDYMEDMNRENRISFTYTATGNIFTTYSGGFKPIGSLGSFCGLFNTSYDQGSVTTEGGEYLVSRIDAQSGYILVNSVPVYPSGPKRVASIQLYDRSDNLKKQYKFNYGSPFASSRQKLISFSAFGSSGTDSLTTKFEYIETENLPGVLSPSVDIWGFYNNAFNDNTGLIPNIIYDVSGVTIDYTAGANRNANWGYGRANILRKITYPGGGYREIVYEGNEAFAAGDFFLYHPNPAFDAPYMTSRNFSETNFNNSGSSIPCLKHLFTVNSTTGKARFYYTLNNPNWACGAYRVKIMRLSTQSDLYGGAEVVTFNQTTGGSQLLQNGYYRVDVFIGANTNESYCTMSGINGQWEESSFVDTPATTPYGNFYSKTPRPVGGVRVKEVRDYDPVTNTISKREYKYKMYSTDSTLTSGLLVSPVNILQSQNISTTNCMYMALCPGSSYPLASEGGSFVVYPEVRTIDSANGWTDDYYSYAPDIPSSSFPYTPAADQSYKRNHLQAKKIYDKNGFLLKHTRLGYAERYGSLTQIGYKYKPYWYVSTYTYTEFKPSPYHAVGIMACNQYGSMGVFWTPSSQVETAYSSTGSITDSTIYTYSSYNDYYYLKSESNFSSNGTARLRTYKYAFNNNSDFRFGLNSNEQTMKSTLLNKNFFQPLEVVDSVKNTGGSYSFLLGSKYIFSTYNYQIHLNTFRLFTAATDSAEIKFSAYDAGGNLLERYKTNDVKEVTIWGYNYTYPVATITGSDLSTVLDMINMSVINAPSSDAAMRSELNKIRTNLAGSAAQVTTYTYSPLQGMTSMTDATGRTIYYEYDLFGRLKLVRDQDGRVIKKIEYKLNNP